MATILVTGANGFVGRALCAELARREYSVRGAIRTPSGSAEPGYELVQVGDVGQGTDWSASLTGVGTVVHLAARVHVMHEVAADPLEAFREVNVAGTERLARMAACSGVRRFVFVSSIKVNGEYTAGVPFSEAELPSPRDAYSISKYEAEQVLHLVAKETGLETVIVRPPLVYGPGVGGNYLRLLMLASRGIPLPLASVDNLRSMIYLGNFVDSLIACATHPSAVGKTYLVSDDKGVSIQQLIRSLACLMGKPSYLWPFPSSILRLVARVIGKSDEVERLIGSLEMDSSKIRRELGWFQPYSIQQGLEATVDWYRNRK